MRPSATQIHAVYQRLLAQESDAPNDFIELFLDPLTEALGSHFPGVSSELVSDVVTDALFKFVQTPQLYQPERGNLWNYLLRDVRGDMLNALDKQKRRQNKEILFDPVAHDRPDGNINIEEEVMQKLEGSSLLEEIPTQNILKRFQSEITDPRDWQVLLLMFDGERRTSAFATIFGINHLPIDEQRVFVKRTKDRLRLRLKRYGVKINEH
jgi:DNA-directed RNA polymerase specialized sigma24 family protein